MTAAARVTVEERDDLAEYMAEVVAPQLAWARKRRDAEEIAALLTPLSYQELYALCLVQSEHWPLPPTPLIRADDGNVDDIAVARCAGGEVLPLTIVERNMVIRLMRKRGKKLREIAEHLGTTINVVAKVLAKPAPEQMALPGGSS